MSFSKIAKVYDRFNEIASYEQWLDFTLQSVAQQPKKVLDVACGTGWFDVLLAPFVEQLVAMDIDEEMLAIAKAEDPNSQTVYQQGDMLNLSSFDDDFDLVTCYADSLCFLADDQEVAIAIEQMLARLKSGGTLLFDVWTPYQVTTGFDSFSYFDTDDHGAILWDSEVDPQSLQVEHYLTVFDKKDTLYERQDTVLTERAYPLEMYQAIFSRLPVASVEVLVDFGAEKYDAKQHQTADRWFFRVIKK